MAAISSPSAFSTGPRSLPPRLAPPPPNQRNPRQASRLRASGEGGGLHRQMSATPGAPPRLPLCCPRVTKNTWLSCAPVELTPVAPELSSVEPVLIPVEPLSPESSPTAGGSEKHPPTPMASVQTQHATCCRRSRHLQRACHGAWPIAIRTPRKCNVGARRASTPSNAYAGTDSTASAAAHSMNSAAAIAALAKAKPVTPGRPRPGADRHANQGRPGGGAIRPTSRAFPPRRRRSPPEQPASAMGNRPTRLLR